MYLNLIPQCSKAGDAVSKIAWRGSIPRGYAVAVAKFGPRRRIVNPRYVGSNPTSHP